MSVYPAIPNTIALTCTSIEGSFKKSTALAIITSSAAIFGAPSTTFFRSQDAPNFSLGFGLVLMLLIISLISTAIFWLKIRRENLRRQRGDCDEIILVTEDATEFEKMEAVLQAENMRRIEVEELMVEGGLKNRIKASRLNLGLRDNGIFATETEAKIMKGDRFSRFRYIC